MNLRTAVTLLPTPKASDGTHGGPNQRDASGRYYLPGQAVRVNEQWLGSNGKDYGPAVRRWEEITGHPAPCPTEAGARGNRRLNPAFSEWMMGLEPGWVTDIVTDRNDALHVIGNGVVPGQAEEAFRFLLDDDNWRTTQMSETEDKPRGFCTGCKFEYQLTAKGLIRKHLSRTGPGECSGSRAFPREYMENLGMDKFIVQGLAAVDLGESDSIGGPVFPTRQEIDNATSVIGMGVPGDVESAAYAVLDSVHLAAPVTISEVHAENPPRPDAATPDHPTTIDAASGDVVAVAPGGIPVRVGAPDPFTSPGARSDIPEEDTTVSGQPEPDRDRWGRYLLTSGGGREPHTRATTFAKLGANTKAIEAWNERNVIVGLTRREDLLMMAQGKEVKRDRTELNSIAEQAKTAAGNKVAANIGTGYHSFTERVDAGLMTVGQVPERYRPRVQQYVEAVAAYGLTTRREWIERTIAVRADQVSAPLPVAGTLDRILQLPDGSLCIGDLKTGSDLSYGEMEIEVQLALYAHGVNTHGLFDWNTKTWQDAPRVRTDIAIVIHLPADGDGCTLYVADIARGWHDAQKLGQLQSSLKQKNRFRTLTREEIQPRPGPERCPAYLEVPAGDDRVMTKAPCDGPVGHGGVHHNEQYKSGWDDGPGPALPAVQAPAHQPEMREFVSAALGHFNAADSKERLAELYQFALDSGKFMPAELRILAQAGHDRMASLGA